MKKKNIILACFIILLVSLIFLQVGVLPQYRQYAQERAQLRRMQKILADKKEYYAQLFTIEQKLNSHQEALAKISSALPVHPDSAALAQLIQQKAAESGLTVENFNDLKINSDSKKKTGLIKLTAILTGNYPSLVSFLKAVEGSSRLVNVESVTLRPGEEEGIPEKAQAPRYTLTFTAHYYNQ